MLRSCPTAARVRLPCLRRNPARDLDHPFAPTDGRLQAPRRALLAAPLLAATLVAAPAEAAKRPASVFASSMGVSTTGGFLAGRLAASLRDNEAAAAFFGAALRANPTNLDLLDRTFLALVSDGDMDKAMRYADRLVQVDKSHRIGRLTLGVRAMKARQYVDRAPEFRRRGTRPGARPDRADAVRLDDGRRRRYGRRRRPLSTR